MSETRLQLSAFAVGARVAVVRLAMTIGTVSRLALLLGLVAAAGGAGCFAPEEETDESSGRVTTSGSVATDALKSTVVLRSGCMATKVGPRHLLTAARCVAGKPEFETGKKIKFLVASKLKPESETTSATAEPEEDEIETESADAGSASDASTLDEIVVNGPAHTQVTIRKVEIHESFTSKCSGETCAFKTIGASDAKDIAVIVLTADLDDVPTVPVDLDVVSEADKLLGLGSECAKFSDEAQGVKTYPTVAVPVFAVTHDGSPYQQERSLTTRLGTSYVVTAGIGWRRGEPEVCKEDVGAPLFRRSKLAVAGLLSNYSTYENADAPVTLHHTRVDATIGDWLSGLGVETTKSCSESSEGCVTSRYTGNLPQGATGAEETDGGVTADAGDAGTEPAPPPMTGAPPPSSSNDDYSTSSDNEEEDEIPLKKKKADSGCSAAPGSLPSSGGGLLALGLAVAAVVARRRRTT
jgi:uncharacterized protein (TIGR03382 family)